MSEPVEQKVDPRAWRDHRFGLSEARWKALAGHGFWITGAGTGYGRALAAALAAAGATVYLSGRRAGTLAESRAAMGEFGVDPARCHIVPVDVTDALQVDAASAAIQGIGAGLHGIVHCAALPEPEGAWPLSEGDPAAWARLMAVNAIGPGLVTRSALPLMTARGMLRVLFFTSEAGWASTPGFGPYNVSKAALNCLAVSFAAEIAARHPGLDAQLNVLIAGEARTEMNQHSIESPFTAVPMSLALLSHPPGGPSGRFFHRDGRHFSFGHAEPWDRPVTDRRVSAPNGRRSLLDRLMRRSR